MSPQIKRKLLLWVIGGLGAGGVLLVLLFLLVGLLMMGMLVASSDSTYKGAPIRNVESLDLPLPLLTVYLQAQNGTISWSQLAAISKVTTDFGKHPAANGGIGFVGFPASFLQQGQIDGDADGETDPNDPYDAIFSLAAFVAHTSDVNAALALMHIGENAETINRIAFEYESSVFLEYGWLWPLVGYRNISSPFGMRSDPFTGETAYHDGIDLPAPIGTPVLAVRDGIVSITSDDFAGYGNYIRLLHANGTETFYGHLSVIGVEAGQFVHQGEVIGAVGTTGRSTGPHLHLGMIQDGRSVDPLRKWFP